MIHRFGRRDAAVDTDFADMPFAQRPSIPCLLSRTELVLVDAVDQGILAKLAAFGLHTNPQPILDNALMNSSIDGWDVFCNLCRSSGLRLVYRCSMRQSL